MEFYLNQKSVPMIRKCGNCQFFYREFSSCSLRNVTNAYEHTKKIFLQVGENLYCDQHRFRNEDTLKREAIVVEYDTLEDALKVISKTKMMLGIRNNTNIPSETSDEND